MGAALLGLFVVTSFSAPRPVAASISCSDSTIWLRGAFGTARFSVDVADDPEARAQGLMFVESMPASKGMLFVYPSPRSVAFWMKNTLIPLDILYADAAGVVRHIHPEAIPGDETPLPGQHDGIQYVLEINGGLAEDMGIGVGAEMHHPAISDAAWPCD
ncbi:DUF192 domain-containing protein [Cognatishimia sp. F0-27]|nr:DUF192 domain-containing protein [Cognatishimia sp. F0-27]